MRYLVVAATLLVVTGSAEAQSPGLTACRQIIADKFEPDNRGKTDLGPGLWNTSDALQLCAPEFLSDSENPAKQYRMARVLIHSEHDRDRKAALTLLTRSSGAGFAPATYFLGHAHHVGLGVDEDREQARTQYELAMSQGHPSAASVLGYAHFYGDTHPGFKLPGISEDKVKAAELLQVAVDGGDLPAMHLWGLMHMNRNSGVAPDYDRGVRWLAVAAEQGYAPSQTSLGWHYDRFGDKNRARYWYNKAAQQGDTLGVSLAATVPRKELRPATVALMGGFLAAAFAAWVFQSSGGSPTSNDMVLQQENPWPCWMMTDLEQALAGC